MRGEVVWMSSPFENTENVREIVITKGSLRYHQKSALFKARFSIQQMLIVLLPLGQRRKAVLKEADLLIYCEKWVHSPRCLLTASLVLFRRNRALEVQQTMFVICMSS